MDEQLVEQEVSREKTVEEEEEESVGVSEETGAGDTVQQLPQYMLQAGCFVEGEYPGLFFIAVY